MIEIASICVASATGFVDKLSPLSYFSQDGYAQGWAFITRWFLTGLWARIFAVLFLISAFWQGVYRQKIVLGIIFFVLALIITYTGGIFGKMFWWST